MSMIMAGGIQSMLPHGVFATAINNQANLGVSQQTQTVQLGQIATVSHDYT